MKVIKETRPDESNLSVITVEEGERVIRKTFFYFLKGSEDRLTGELVIPEGIEEIEDGAFSHLGVMYSVYRLPRSLKRLGEALLYYEGIKLIYPGSSEEFKSLATVREDSVYESDGFDHSPYYSGGSRWATRYYCFDTSVDYVEVICEADGVTLIYGRRNRRDKEEPKIKN